MAKTTDGNLATIYISYDFDLKKYYFKRSLQTMASSNHQVNPSSGITNRKVIHFFLPKRDDIKLHSTKNAWVPSCLRAKDTNNSRLSNDEESQIEVNIRVVTHSIIKSS